MSPRLKREKDQLCICFTEPRAMQRVSFNSAPDGKELSATMNKRGMSLMTALHDLLYAKFSLRGQILPAARDLDGLSYYSESRSSTESVYVAHLMTRLETMRDEAAKIRAARERVRLAFAGLSPKQTQQLREVVTIDDKPIERWWEL